MGYERETVSTQTHTRSFTQNILLLSEVESDSLLARGC